MKKLYKELTERELRLRNTDEDIEKALRLVNKARAVLRELLMKNEVELKDVMSERSALEDKIRETADEVKEAIHDELPRLKTLEELINE